MDALKKYLEQQLPQILGQTLSEPEFSSCWKNTEILEPGAGKLFWESTEAAKGIYLIVEGKVRLSDRDDNLIVSLERGASFGELTLFAKENFQPYRARASVNLKLCYLKGDCLQSAIDRHPAIRDYLYRQALRRDLLLLHHHTSNGDKTSLQNLSEILPLLEQHRLESGKLPHFLIRERQLWLIRRGELLHSSGQKLTPGNIYKLSELPKNGAWQVTQPTELYTLDRSQWQRYTDESSALNELNGSKSKLAKPAQSIELKTADKQKLNSKSKIQNPKSKIQKTYFPHPTVKVGQWWQHSSGRYPFYKQQSATDCGVACLVMIGRYWGKRFSVNHLRTLVHLIFVGEILEPKLDKKLHSQILADLFSDWLKQEIDRAEIRINLDNFNASIQGT